MIDDRVAALDWSALQGELNEHGVARAAGVLHAHVNENNGKVREDRVVFSWITNASFAAATKGHVVLLDSFVGKMRSGRRDDGAGPMLPQV